MYNRKTEFYKSNLTVIIEEHTNRVIIKIKDDGVWQASQNLFTTPYKTAVKEYSKLTFDRVIETINI